jgi:FKBP-type peptidyl-prolyl cis-trans isomerase
MKALAATLLFAALASAGCASAATTAPEITTDEHRTLYALGTIVANRGGLAQFGLTEAEIQFVKAGIEDAALGRQSKVDLTTFGPKVNELAQARRAAAATAEKQASEEFLAKAAAEAGAVRSESGLVYREMTPGTGESPKPEDRVRVHYTGTLRDGKVFDSSVQRGEPAEFALNGVIPCWTEGLQKMKVGGKSRLVCPSGIAYGDRGAGGDIKPGAALAFEVELLAIVK